MKNFALFVIALVGTNAIADDVVYKPTGLAEWKQVCVLVAEYGVTCDGVAPPAIDYAEFPKQVRDTLQGTVARGTVWLNWHTAELKIPGEIQSWVIAHEMVHYLLDAKGLVDMKAELCRSEAYAHDVSNRWAELYGNPRMIETKWWKHDRRCSKSDARTPALAD